FQGSDGEMPLAGLVRGIDGGYYGTTYSGGASNTGTIFRLIEQAADPVITGVSTTNDLVTLTWTSEAHKTYRVEYNAKVAETNWVALVPDLVATGSSTSITNNVAGVTQRYYRIELLP